MSDLTYQEVRALISKLSGGENFIGIPRPLLEMVKDHVAALVLNQALFYMNSADADGWVSRSHEEWHNDIFVSAYQLRRAFEVLAEFGLETKVKKAGRAPTLHFRINSETFVQRIRKHFDNQETSLSNPIIKKLDNQETSLSISDAESEETRLSRNFTIDSEETSFSSISKNKEPREEKSKSVSERAELLLISYSEIVGRDLSKLHHSTKRAWRLLIENRLREDWTDEQIGQVWVGCRKDKWPDRPKFNAVTDLLSDPQRIDHFINLAELPEGIEGNGKASTNQRTNYNGKPPVTRDFSKYPARTG